MSDNGMIYDPDLEQSIKCDEDTMANEIFGTLKKKSLCKVIGGLLLFGAGVVVGAASNSVMVNDHGWMNGNEHGRQLYADATAATAAGDKKGDKATPGKEPLTPGGVQDKDGKKEGGKETATNPKPEAPALDGASVSETSATEADAAKNAKSDAPATGDKKGVPKEGDKGANPGSNAAPGADTKKTVESAK